MALESEPPPRSDPAPMHREPRVPGVRPPDPGHDVVGPERERALLRGVDCGVWTTDANGDMTYLSPSLLGMVDRRLEQCLGRRFLDVLDVAEREHVRQQWEACVLTQSEWHSVHALPVAPGRVRDVLVPGFPSRDAEGNLVGWVGLIVDVTDLRPGDRGGE